MIDFDKFTKLQRVWALDEEMESTETRIKSERFLAHLLLWLDLTEMERFLKCFTGTASVAWLLQSGSFRVPDFRKTELKWNCLESLILLWLNNPFLS